MNTFKKVEIIYQDSIPDGNRIVRINLSPITAYVIPRPFLAKAKSLHGINNPGIYFLINESEDNKIAEIYIGQTRNGIKRLDDHNRNKEFWNKAIMFLADRKTCTLDMISWLESYAIQKAKASNRYIVTNTVNPNININDYDMSDVEKIYSDIQFIISTLGYKMDYVDKYSVDEKEVLHTTINKISALGLYNGEKFQVLKDSEIDMTRDCRSHNINLQRLKLYESGKIVKRVDKYYLQMTIDFSSPSSAAQFVLGGSRNGWIIWKNKDGKCIDELYRNK